MKQDQINQAIDALKSIDLTALNNENVVKNRIKEQVNNEVESFNRFFKTHELLEYGVAFEEFTALKQVDKRIAIDQYIFEQGFHYLKSDYGNPDIYEMETVIDGANQIAKEFRATYKRITRLNELLHGKKK